MKGLRRSASRRAPIGAANGLPDDATARLLASISILDNWNPECSARRPVNAGQRATFVIGLVILTTGLVFATTATLTALICLSTIGYLLALFYKVWLFIKSRDHRALVTVTDIDALAMPDAHLPRYSLLVPAFHEPESIPQLLAAIDALDYPKELLDVQLLLEADDRATVDAARAARPGPHVEIVEIPASEPRTKPKALNYGLLGAKGELVTIFDAEDIPEPLQLRRAAVAFARFPLTSCFQAKLSFYNSRQNLITRWFTLEYAMWFTDLLPGVVRVGAPVPLGGTSNHFRRDALVRCGAWDPYNVTEDADLGIRLDRLGMEVGLLDSVTSEEATSDFVNWVKQRSRWYKGYLQSWLVHMRSPRKTLDDLGVGGFIGFTLLVGGTPVFALLNVLNWTLTLAWFILRPSWTSTLFPPWVYYPALFSFIIGNFLVIYLGVLSARIKGNHDLVIYALLMPLYWLMMAVAAFKAAFQLVFAPSFWEKTTHGMADARALTSASSSVVDLAAAERAEASERSSNQRTRS